MSFVERLRELIGLENITQVELSELLGISTGAVNTYFAGKRKPNYEVLEKFHNLGYSIDWLISGKGTMKRHGSLSELTYILVYEDDITYTMTNPNIVEAKILAEAEQIKKGLGRRLKLIITLEEGKIVKITNGKLS